MLPVVAEIIGRIVNFLIKHGDSFEVFAKMAAGIFLANKAFGIFLVPLIAVVKNLAKMRLALAGIAAVSGGGALTKGLLGVAGAFGLINKRALEASKSLKEAKAAAEASNKALQGGSKTSSSTKAFSPKVEPIRAAPKGAGGPIAALGAILLGTLFDQESKAERKARDELFDERVRKFKIFLGFNADAEKANNSLARSFDMLTISASKAGEGFSKVGKDAGFTAFQMAQVTAELGKVPTSLNFFVHVPLEARLGPRKLLFRQSSRRIREIGLLIDSVGGFQGEIELASAASSRSWLQQSTDAATARRAFSDVGTAASNALGSIGDSS